MKWNTYYVSRYVEFIGHLIPAGPSYTKIIGSRELFSINIWYEYISLIYIFSMVTSLSESDRRWMNGMGWDMNFRVGTTEKNSSLQPFSHSVQSIRLTPIIIHFSNLNCHYNIIYCITVVSCIYLDFYRFTEKRRKLKPSKNWTVYCLHQTSEIEKIQRFCNST